MTQPVKIFVGGFGDHSDSRAVFGYYERYRRNNPDMACSYHVFDDYGPLRTRLREVGPDAHVTVVGHSWGADTAFSVLDVRPADVLISIDPVAWFQHSWTNVRARARTWLNVRSEPAVRDDSDRIADFGTRYGRPPAPPGSDAPNYSYQSLFSHGRFDNMLWVGQPNAITLMGGRPTA